MGTRVEDNCCQKIWNDDDLILFSVYRFLLRPPSFALDKRLIPTRYPTWLVGKGTKKTRRNKVYPRHRYASIITGFSGTPKRKRKLVLHNTKCLETTQPNSTWSLA
jgi:hypothetical protein